MGRKANTLEIEQLALPWDTLAEASNPPANLRTDEGQPVPFVATDADLPDWLFEDASCGARKPG